MYRLFLIYVLLHITDCTTIISSTLCQRRSAGYCRPSFPRTYGLPHNDYLGYEPSTSTTPTPTTTIETTTLAPRNTFESLAQILIEAESAIRRYCLNVNTADVKELYGNSSYVLTYTLRDVVEDNVSVRIKHRVLYVTVEKFGVTTFKDLRILPTVLDTQEAAWILTNDILEIFIPYAVLTNKEGQCQCQNINEALINVPKGEFTYREGNLRILANQNQIFEMSPNTQDSLDDAINIIFGPTDNQEMIDVRNNNAL